ncbi:glycerophosphodiester phosphodiesterase [Micavibrio aeruginosavorus]|uniref:glycerophosphodiester phosphodiesterase n=1 Tax=Micavibrio aeruginosavorus TaxID=349221 RepID=UPI003F4A88B8
MTIKIIGHRGNGRTTETPFAEGKAPQQTLLSFVQAIENGADGVEFDVFLTRDQIPVVIDKDMVFGHVISEMDCADVQRIPLPMGQYIPTLEETLILLSGMNATRAETDDLFINIELKGPNVVRPTMSVVESVANHYGLKKNTIYYSATDRQKLSDVRMRDAYANIQPTILTMELFAPEKVHQPGYYVSPRTAYNKAALGDLSQYIRDMDCCAIDVPTTDIRPQLIDVANDLGVGFCTHPSGPRRYVDHGKTYNALTMLYNYAERSGWSVAFKVDDIAAGRIVVNAASSQSKAPVPMLERAMGTAFYK